jgi:hypothetical protein
VAWAAKVWAMTRDDVANLVIRTFALWLGASGLGTLGSMPWMMEGAGGRGELAGYASVRWPRLGSCVTA